MLSELTGTDDGEGGQTDESGDGSGLLRAVPFAAAFAAGFALGRQSGRASRAGRGESGGRQTASDRKTASDQSTAPDQQTASDQQTAPDQPSSMGSVAGEEERQRDRQATSPADTDAPGAQPGGSEAAGIDERVAELSAPTTHGMPMLGLGTYQNDEYDQCLESVRQALQMGYRHVDTAQMYDNETAVGDAIVEAEVGRDDLFVASKVEPDNLAYDHVLESTEESLERLGIDTLDLLYVHWPTGEYEPTDTLDAFAELRQEGLIEEIGVSNFTVDLLEEAIEVSEEPIFANQVEMHPLLPQTELREFCAQKDVDVELVAYSPIARAEVEEVTEIREVAEKHDATAEQVSLAWLREKDVTAIPKATGREHLRENWLSLDVELDDEDVAKIDGIDRRERLVDPDEAPWNR